MSKIDQIKDRYYLIIICVAVIATTASVTAWFYNRQIEIKNAEINLMRVRKDAEIKTVGDQLANSETKNKKLIKENLELIANCTISSVTENTEITQRNMTIYAAQKWQSSGIDIQRGDGLKIHVEGEIRYSGRKTAPGKGLTGPVGVPPYSPPKNGDKNDFRAYSIKPEWNHCSVIGKIGEQIILIGQDRDFTSNYSGKLYLAINDNHTEDNSGSFKATIRHESM